MSEGSKWTCKICEADNYQCLCSYDEQFASAYRKGVEAAMRLVAKQCDGGLRTGLLGDLDALMPPGEQKRGGSRIKGWSRFMARKPAAEPLSELEHHRLLRRIDEMTRKVEEAKARQAEEVTPWCPTGECTCGKCRE